MSFSGGVYTLPGPALATGEVVSATENNQFRNDVSGAFNLTFLRNGTSTATANLPMGGYKLTGLGLATTSGDALSYGQAAVISDLTASGTVTISSGTANGVAYLNGSKVLTTGSALTFDGTNFTSPRTQVTTAGTPPASGAGIELVGGTTPVLLTYNRGTSAYLPLTTSASAHSWTLSGSDAMVLTSTGLGIGTSSPSTKLDVNGSITVASTGAVQWGSGFIDYISGDAVNHRLQFYTNNAERMRLDTSGNLGLGVTPSAWASGYKAIQLGSMSSIMDTGTATRLYNNSYVDNGGTSRYLTTNTASSFQQAGGNFYWFTAPSGTAGNAISFTQAMTLDASGRLGIGLTSMSRELQIYGGAPSLQLQNASSGTGNTDGFQVQLSGSDTYLWNWENGAQIFATNNTERMRIDSSGNVGIGTSSPVGRLSAIGSDNSTQAVFSGSIGGTGRGLRIATSLIASNNEGAILDAQATTGSATLIFQTASTERMRIDTSGNLLVGKTSASYTTQGCFVDYRGTFNSATPTGIDFLNCYSTTAGAYRFYVTNAGTVNATNNTISSISDIRFKENVRDLDVGLASVMELKPRLYDWKEGKGANIKNARGFIAQEFEQVFPDLIDEWREPAPEGEEPYKSVRQDLIPVLVKAIQELKAELDATKAEVAALKGN